MDQKLALAGLLTLSLAGGAHAEDGFALGGPSTQLDQILVTDGRVPVALAESGRAISVISGDELAADHVQYVADALAKVPGIAISRTGSAGGLTQVRMRGAEANHVLVMIDGVEVSDPSTGEVDFGSLVVDNIERIEVLRGPQSAFWGSNATAGVINIVTRQGSRDGFSVHARTEAGTDGTLLGAVSLGGGSDSFDFALSALHRQSEGFNISDLGSERDGDVNTTLNARFSADPSPDLLIDGTFRLVDRLTDYDSQDYDFFSPTYGQVLDTSDQTATRDLVGALGVTHFGLDGALTQKLKISGTKSARDNFTSGVIQTWTKSDRLNASYQASYQFDTPEVDAQHTLTGGLEWEQESFLPSHLASGFNRTTKSIVGEYKGAFADQLFVHAGLRYDINDQFANALTYALSGAWEVPQSGARLHASLGTGVTAPTFYEQYGYLPNLFTGNPGLMPEQSLGWDIGIEQTLLDGGLVVDVTWFNQNLTNEITTDYSGPLPTPINETGESKRRGVEISATADFFNGLTATAGYTYTDATEQATSGGPEVQEIRRPRHGGKLNLTYDMPDNKARVFGEVVFSAGMIDTDFATFTNVPLSDYARVNIGGSYHVAEGVDAFVRVENLFDTAYEQVLGYNTQGRTIYAGLNGQF